jgi:hypothetical protein
MRARKAAVTHRGDNWRDLTPQERIELCRRQAREAQDQASAAAPSRKMAYQVLAVQWLDLAAEIERAANESPDPAQKQTQP